MQKYKLKFLSILLITIITSLLLPAITVAGDYSISPAKSAYTSDNPESRFAYYLSADPAEVLKSVVNIKNTGNKTINVKIVPVDAFHDIGNSFILASPGAEQIGIGAWTKLEEDSFKLGPKQNLDVPFEITIPTQIAPGTYFGGMMIGAISSDETQQGENGVSVKSFVGVKIFLDISGEEVIKFKWNKFSHNVNNDTSSFVYEFTNDGNVMLKANLDLKINNLFGGEVFTDEMSTDAFPGKETSYSIKWKDRPAFGFFTAKSTLNYSKTDIFGKAKDDTEPVELTKSTTFYIIPVLYLSIILGVLILLIIFITSKIVSMRNFKRQLKEYKVKKGDTLFELATKGNVSWEKLAKANKIKPPYMLIPGQTILIKSSK